MFSGDGLAYFKSAFLAAAGAIGGTRPLLQELRNGATAADFKRENKVLPVSTRVETA
jgi:hypothetical protein